MTRFVALFAALFAFAQLALLDVPAAAKAGPNPYQSTRIVSVESWIEEWDPASGQWVRVANDQLEAAPLDPRAYRGSMPTITTTVVNDEIVSETHDWSHQAARFAHPFVKPGEADRLAQYGPFIVTSASRAALIGPTDGESPRHFDALLRDFPMVATLELIEAPGTSNDLANLEVGRMIRAAGIATHVPVTGSVRSGAVELFLAGAVRTLEDGAQFAVHSWLDNYGREAGDLDFNHPAHDLYLDYYVEMGMSEARARDFYAMTNSVPHASALWLRADEMRVWLAPDGLENSVTVAAVPTLDYGDLNAISIAWLDLSRLDSRAAFP